MTRAPTGSKRPPPGPGVARQNWEMAHAAALLVLSRVRAAGDQTKAFTNALNAVQTQGYKVLLGPNRSAQSQLVSAVGAGTFSCARKSTSISLPWVDLRLPLARQTRGALWLFFWDSFSFFFCARCIASHVAHSIPLPSPSYSNAPCASFGAQHSILRSCLTPLARQHCLLKPTTPTSSVPAPRTTSKRPCGSIL